MPLQLPTLAEVSILYTCPEKVISLHIVKHLQRSIQKIYQVTVFYKGTKNTFRYFFSIKSFQTQRIPHKIHQQNHVSALNLRLLRSIDISCGHFDIILSAALYSCTRQSYAK